MKVGILTFHAAHNFGSMLQAYALQTIIKKAGHECKIINLRLKSQKELYDYKNVYCLEKNPIKKSIKKIVFRYAKQQYDLFENFLQQYMDLTEEYDSIEMFENQGEDFDVYVSGSDQIWNVNAKDYNEAYMLSFNKQGKRIAYAVSAGSGKCNYSKYKKVLTNYAAIGVREFELKKSLEDIAISSMVTVDPTLLLDVQEWNQIRNKKFEESLPDKYILFYSLGYGEEEKKIINYFRKKYKMPVLAPNRLYTDEAFRGIRLVPSCGPSEFVSLFAKATFVFTTSFHGCVFSTIYKRNFAAYLPNEGNIDTRKVSLLEITGQKYRGVENLEDAVKLVESISHKTEDQQLKTAISISKKWLENAMNS